MIGYSSGYSQRLHFNTLSIYDGMSQNMINCILQDHQGYMWFGTKDGLNRYDGYSFKIFKADLFDSTSIGDNHITYLYEDDLNNLWISTQFGGLFLYDRTTNSFFDYNTGDLKAGIDHILSIKGNSKAGIWLSSSNGNIFKMTIKSQHKGQCPDVNITKELSKSLIGAPRAEDLILVNQRTLWILTGKGLRLYDIDQKKFVKTTDKFKIYKFVNPSKPKVPISSEYSPFHKFMMSSYIDEDGYVWISGELGVYRCDPRTSEILLYEIKGWVKSFIVTKNLSGEKEIWAGTFYNDLNIINVQTGITKHIKNWELTNREDQDQVITKIFKSKDGNIWFGTNGKGLAQYSPYTTLFSNNMPDKIYGSLIASRSIYTIYPLGKEKDSGILLSSLRYFLEYMPGGKSYIDSTFYIRVAQGDDRGTVWMGSTIGLLRYFPKKKTYDIVDPIAKDITGIYVDSQFIWCAASNALKCYNIQTGEKQTFQLPESIIISGQYTIESTYSTLQPDGNDILWIGTVNGLVEFDMRSRKVIHIYRNNPKDRQSINSNEIKCILPDAMHPEATLWVGTPVGLNKLDKKRGTFTQYGISEGLPNNTVYGILSDSKGNLWISTNQGIALFNPRTEEFTIFDHSNGLQSNEFNTGAYFKSDWGEMFFGGINGYNRFYPEQINVPKQIAPIVISDIQFLHNGRMQSLIGPLAQKLKYSENNITIALSSLDYTSPQKIKYSYRIYNRDTSWLQLGNNRVVTLSNLGPGKYIFQAKGTDSFGRWSKDYIQVIFIISPPWWNSILAQLMYILVSLVVVYFLWRYNKQRLIQKHQVEEDKRKAATILELDKAKSRFLTNITHEFRTPLTVILGLTEQSMVPVRDEDKVVKNNKTIHRNGLQLLTLVDQILELAKLESGNLQLNVHPGNLKDFIAILVNSFESLAQLNHITLTYHHAFTDYYYLYDKEKIQQILSNLISNSIKFSKKGGQVAVTAAMEHTAENNYLIFSVKDTGIGIDADELSTIFDRFHRAKSNDSKQLPGTGIGLALVKELTELMNGSIMVTSERDTGSIFVVKIPVESWHGQSSVQISDEVITDRPQIFRDDYGSAQVEETDEVFSLTEIDQICVLIVEDNPDVRNYIISCLQDHFKIISAVDGKQGLEKAIQYMPDMIISDVMMPVMDGFEMCHAIKTNSLTNHIPIILLTAKVDADSRITGLKKGADAYLAKPFVKEELMLRLENMSQLIVRMRAHYLTLIKVGDSSDDNKIGAEHNSIEEEMPGDAFLYRAMELLENHYTDEEYSVEMMAQSLYMSRSQLFRKIKSLTGKSPSTFLRTFRLNKAKKLLTQHPEKNISEVAYATGFNSPKYFSNVFLEEFGHRPKEQ